MEGEADVTIGLNVRKPRAKIKQVSCIPEKLGRFENENENE